MLENEYCNNPKIVLVTGATRGIGKGIAENLARSGLTVVGTATTVKGKQTITENLQVLGNTKSFGVMLDLSDRDSIQNAISEIHTNVGEPVILINNAGITKDNLFLRMKTEEWDQVITANLDGVFHVTKACIKAMLKSKWGRIINISSVVACSGNIGQANYAAAKAGIIGFTKSLAQEVATRNITVNTIAPGFIETDMTKCLSETAKEHLLSKIPMGKFGKVEDLVAAVRFLISEEASYITGSTIHINGGMLMN